MSLRRALFSLALITALAVLSAPARAQDGADLGFAQGFDTGWAQDPGASPAAPWSGQAGEAAPYQGYAQYPSDASYPGSAAPDGSAAMPGYQGLEGSGAFGPGHSQPWPGRAGRFQGFLFPQGSSYRIVTVDLERGMLRMDGQPYRLAELRIEPVYYATAAADGTEASPAGDSAATAGGDAALSQQQGASMAPGSMIASVRARIVPMILYRTQANGAPPMKKGSDGFDKVLPGDASTGGDPASFMPPSIGTLQGYLVRKSVRPPMPWYRSTADQAGISPYQAGTSPYQDGDQSAAVGDAVLGGAARCFPPRPRPGRMVLEGVVDLGGEPASLYTLATAPRAGHR